MGIMERHAAIYWKKGSTPGISIVGDEIREWPDTLGPRPTEAEIQEWTAEYLVWKADQDQAAIALAEEKAAAIADNLPSWQAISDAIDAATTIAALKVIVKKGFRACYVHIKDDTT